MDRPVLAIVGHGTDGNDGIEPGIHLRWAFRREIGFPPGGFCLYRRPAKRPPMRCIDFGHLEVGRLKSGAIVRQQELTIRVESDADIAAERIPVNWASRVGEVRRELNLDELRDGSMIVLATSAMRIGVPPTTLVIVEATAQPGSEINAMALAGNREAAEGKSERIKQGAVSLVLAADVIDTITVAAPGLKVIRICFALPEPCEDMEGWKQVIPCPMCLPVRHWAYPCKQRGAQCDEEVAWERLPKEPCAQRKYSGSNLDDLLNAVRVAIDPGYGRTMGSRLLDFTTEADDCPPPEADAPEIEVSALDILLIAAVDPLVARILGLYYVDGSTRDESFDYKIVGTWPEGTLWSLENTVTFDERTPGFLVPPAFVHENLTLLFNRWSSIVAVPTNFAGTSNGLSVQPEGFDWLPFLNATDIDPPSLVIKFDAPVGEAQVFARHSGEKLVLRAFRNGDEVAATSSTVPDALLAIHAPEIDTLVVSGSLTMLFRIDYEEDYIPHGMHCHIAYGLFKRRAEKLAAPGHVRGDPIPGVTRKVSDCEPLGSGLIADTRHLIGIRWKVSTDADQELYIRDPIRFRIERENPDATTSLISGDDPISVVPPDADSTIKPAADWPPERPYHIDTVPYPGTYRFRVEGIDIFGRASGFGVWSSEVDVEQIEPPPPAAVTAKWLDPKDPNLTAADKDWIEDDQKEGLLIRWEWLDSLERQAPFVEGFSVLLEKGWLNHLPGTVEADPVDLGADTFQVDVQFERQLGANVLAGMTMSRSGIPYRIRANTATGGAAPYISTLTCRAPASGVPTSYVGVVVAVPLIASVRGVVREVQWDSGGRVKLNVLFEDLAALPPAGFVGGALQAGDDQWEIRVASGAAIEAGGVGVDIRIDTGVGSFITSFFNALGEQQVRVELPAPSPPYIDYRDAANWSRFVASVPSEGNGIYEVFVREADLAEVGGRTAVDLRKHLILTDFPLVEVLPIAYGQAAIATEARGKEGTASSPAAFVRVQRATPVSAALLPVPGANVPGDTPAIHASLPDYDGMASYAHRWIHDDGMRYIVYRALNETLFAVDRSVRSRRSKVRADWDAFLNQFPDPEGVVRNMAFDLFINQSSAPDYINLNPRNRLLQILASFPDVIEAFSRLNEEPIRWHDARFDDRLTQVAGPGEIEYVPQANCRLYHDRRLPGRGLNSYFYRVKTLDALGNAGSMGASTPPIYMRALAIPTMPILSEVAGADGAIVSRWITSQRPGVAEYQVYRIEVARLEDGLPFERVGSVPIDTDDPDNRGIEIVFRDRSIVPYTDYAYFVVAVGPTGLPSEPSSTKVARAFDYGVQDAPAFIRTDWVRLDAEGREVAWADAPELPAAVAVVLASPKPKAKVLVQRHVAGNWQSVAPWQSSATFDEVLESWQFTIYDNRDQTDVEQQYRAKLMSYAGIESNWTAVEVVPPAV